jgi:hypothetical protein
VPGNTAGRVGSSIILFFDFPSDLLTRAVPSNTAGRVSPLVFVWEKGFLAARAVSGDTGRVWLQEFPSIFSFFFFHSSTVALALPTLQLLLKHAQYHGNDIKRI